MHKNTSPHTFHIPVMGTGFTIDTPLFVAKYGISSVISLVDDVLIEQMRKFWCEKSEEPYEEISSQDIDARAKRITAYLNLLQKLINKQIMALKASSFDCGGEIVEYFEMLPEGPVKTIYKNMIEEKDQAKKLSLQKELKESIVAGTIDVNIMTKLDCQKYQNGNELPYEFGDAASALRGYANSDLCSTIVFSAGFNQKLYNYLTQFDDFFPDKNGNIKKKICIKVSDYRSAAIQGKYLAKHGVWVSEYRVESPLNCGGHAFINDGQLIGQILEEFKQRRDELAENLYSYYKNTIQKNTKKFYLSSPKKIKITAQGGVGNNNEHDLLLKYYKVDSVGWGTPFLLVKNAINVDQPTIDKLINIKKDDVYLSPSSPLGVPFWNLRNSSSEESRIERIKKNTPGSFCIKGYLKNNQEFTEKPICRASYEYQKSKLKQLDEQNLPLSEFETKKQEIISKSCICHELGGGVLIKNKITNNMSSAICPGPNIINFKNTYSLKEMVEHIYGYCSLLISNERPHMFIQEIQLQINYLANEIKNSNIGLLTRPKQKLAEIKQTISDGIEYYKKIAATTIQNQQDKFLLSLQKLQKEIDGISVYA